MKLWQPQSFRFQLLIWFVGSVTALWLVFIGVTGIVVKQLLTQQIDHHIHVVLLEVARVWQESDITNRNAAIANFVSSQGMIVMVLADDGSAILQTTSPDVTVPTQQELLTVLGTQTKSTPQDPYHFTAFNTRFTSISIPFNERTGVIAVGYSLEILYNTLRTIFLVIAGLSLALIIGLIFMGKILVNKALQPILNIITAAQSIRASDDLNKRIPQPTTQDELGTLTHTINDMLSALQTTFEQERQFFSDAAHTLKTPLASLRTQLELSLGQPTLITTRQKISTGIQLIDQSSQVVTDLLLLSTLEHQTKRTIVNISNLLTDIVQLSQPIADKKNITIKINIQDHVKIKGDKKLLTKALMSLIENAIRYSEANDQVTISLKQSAKNINISIQDTGPGIAPAEQQKVWERFYRGQSGMKSGSGSGLGMAITKAVIEAHHGSITLTSKQTHGTTFTISLPISS